MGRIAIPGLFVLAFLALAPGGSGPPLKENLDLPYNAYGVDEEEEPAPEVIFFYGHGYEADAVVFALDESGSMRNNGRWALQTRETVRAIMQLTERGEFSVLYYGSNVTPFNERPVKASMPQKSSAAAFIASRSPHGDTCLFEGVIKALQIAQRANSGRRAVIVTSDGRPDVCATGDRATEAQIESFLQMTLQANPGLTIPVHSVWVGAANDPEGIHFMKRLASVHGGTFRQVTY